MSEEKPKQERVNEPGNENPWYVMMTIAGEQKDLLAEGEVTANDLAPLSREESKTIKQRN